VLLYGNNYPNAIMGNTSTQKKIDLLLPITYSIDTSLKLKLAAAIKYAQLSNSSTAQQQTSNVFQLMPGVQFRKNGFNAEVGIYPTAGKDEVYILPDVKLGYTINNTQLSLFV